MRNLSAGNKSKFVIFAVLIVIIIIVLIFFLRKALMFEKEVYQITKGSVLYDNKKEYIQLANDATIEKKWNDKYYLIGAEENVTYDLGTTAIAYDSIKNRLSLYGNFYDIALDGNVTKVGKFSELMGLNESKLYKIEDRKYLIVSDKIVNETETLTADNYLIVLLDKSGNTLLMNNNTNVKTINALVLKTDDFIFDVANEKLIDGDKKIDLKKIIGSTNQYVELAKTEKTVEEKDGDEKDADKDENTNREVAMNQPPVANSYTSTTVNNAGATSINIGSVIQRDNNNVNSSNRDSNTDNIRNTINYSTNKNNTINNTIINNTINYSTNKNNTINNTVISNTINYNSIKNNTINNTITKENIIGIDTVKSNIINNGGNGGYNTGNNNGNGGTGNSGSAQVQPTGTKDTTRKPEKSANLRNVVPGGTYIDIEYSVIDPENEYQVVYIQINGGGDANVIALDKSQDYYRISGLKQNTNYTLTLGYREIKNNTGVEEVTADVLTVKTLRLQGSIVITKVTESSVIFNLRLDPDIVCTNPKINVIANFMEIGNPIDVNEEEAKKNSGWTYELERTPEISGKLTLSLDGADGLKLSSSTQL